MPVCTSRACGCAIVSTDLAISGSGTPIDPWILGFPIAASQLPERTFINAATRNAALPSPAEGQEVWLQTEDIKTRFFGGIWRTVYQPITNYSPVFTAYTVGTSTVVSRYWREGDTVHYQGSVVHQAGASFSGAAVMVSLPVTASYVNRVTGTAGYYDSSAGTTFAGACSVAAGGTTMSLYVMVGGAFNPTNTNPLPLNVNDEMWWDIAYPAV